MGSASSRNKSEGFYSVNTEVPPATREEMATSRPPEESEESVYREVHLLDPEDISEFRELIPKVQEFLNLAPRLADYNCQLEEQNERLTVALVEARVNVSESNVENISSSNRPSSLERKYQDFYDHERADAIDAIENLRRRNTPDESEEDNRIACIIFEQAYRLAQDSKEGILNLMAKILIATPAVGVVSSSQQSDEEMIEILLKTRDSEGNSLSEGVMNHLKVILKETADNCNVTDLTKRLWEKMKKKEETGRFESYPHLLSDARIHKYMEHCCQYAWRLVCQTPPYVLGTRKFEFNKPFNEERHQISRDASHGNPSRHDTIENVVWPGLFVGSPLRVIRKSEVVLYFAV